jgi:hypothetical protein
MQVIKTGKRLRQITAYMPLNKREKAKKTKYQFIN